MTVFGLLLAAGRGRRFDPAGRRSKLEALINGEAVAVRALQRLAAGCDQVVAVCRHEQTDLARRLGDAGARIVMLDPVALARSGEGMGVSLAAGAAAISALMPCPDTDHLLVMPADMPWILPATVRLIAAADTSAPIVVPVLANRPGVDMPSMSRPNIGRPGMDTTSMDTTSMDTTSMNTTGMDTAGMGMPGHDAANGTPPPEGHPVRFSAHLLGELAALGGDRGARVLFSRHAVLRLPVTDRGIIDDIDTPADLDAGRSSPQS